MGRMWIKILGLTCILSGCCLYGMELEANLKRHYRFLQEMREALASLEKELTYHRTPLPDALLHVAGFYSSDVKKILLGTAKEVKKRDGRLLAEIWSEVLAVSLRKEFLQDEEKKVLSELPEALCAPDVITQKSLLERSISHLEHAEHKAEADYREKGMLYRKLSVAAGVFLIIFLA